MGRFSKIQWCHHSFNGWWGCSRVSPACTFCYAEAFAKRTGHGVWGKESPRRFFGEKHWNEPRKWNRKAQERGVRERVFSASMADVFEERSDLDESRLRLWNLIEETPNLDWLLLTKRPWNISSMVPRSWMSRPAPNVWYGTTTENQEWADKRIPPLFEVPAVVRFISAEPLLGRVNFHLNWPGLSWVIAGCESGPKARPTEWEWFRSLRDQCAVTGSTAFFLKQAKVNGKVVGTPELDGETWTQIPKVLQSALQQ